MIEMKQSGRKSLALTRGAVWGVMSMALMIACQGEQTGDQASYPSASSSPEGALSATLSKHERAIQGGEVDASRKNVVGLVIQQGYSGGGCSGSLIAPNLVLTAQHCISSVSTNGILCGTSRFSPVYSPRSIFVTTETEFPRFGYYEVSEVLVPVAQADVCGNDIALLVLDRNIVPSVTDPLIPRLDEPVEAGELFTAVGYGHTGDGSGAGVRRFIENRRVICSGYLNGCQDGNQGIYENEWVGNDGTCEGDSGGPALDDRGQVIGVLSRGAEGCIYPVYTDVVGHKDWIREQARRASTLGSYPLPSWVDGMAGVPPLDSDDDGIADRFDNCDEVVNPLQQDLDADGVGDLCDPLISQDRGGSCTVCDSCQNDSECASDGGVCLQLQTGGVCTYPCRGSFECPDTSICIPVSYDTDEKYCFNEDVNVNGPCPLDYQCGGPRGDISTPVDDGACHVCEPCSRGDECASGFCAQVNGASFCSRACEQDSDCRGNSRCAELSGMKLCINPDISEGGLCNEAYSCEASLEPPEGGAMVVGGEEPAGVEAPQGATSDGGASETEGGAQGSQAEGDEKEATSDDTGCQGTRGPVSPLTLALIALALVARRRLLV